MADITAKESRVKNYRPIYYILNFIQQNIDNALILTYYNIIEGNYTDICCPLCEISSKLKKYICTFKSLLKINGIKYIPQPKEDAYQIKEITQNLSTACTSVFNMVTLTLLNSKIEELHTNYVLVYFVMHYVQKMLSSMIDAENSKKTEEQKRIEEMYLQLNVCGSELEKEMNKNGIKY